MHEHLERAAATLGVELPSLAASHEFSERQIREARLSFRKRLGDNHGLDIVVCGSMARREMSTSSDFDYLVVAHGLIEDASRLRSFRAACDDWCMERGIPPPGSTGIFGTVVSGAELVEQIGLEFDTNASLTRRILLMEEGVSVLSPKLHERFVEVILGRYFYEDHSDASRSQRFLLNDIARYWRTIAVDYQAKVWRDLSVDGWGLRYLKLRISRKLTYVSALVALFMVEITKASEPRAFLKRQFVDTPALARVAQLVDVLDGDERSLHDLRRVLQLADEFCAFLHDSECRDAAKRVLPPASEATDAAFVAMRAASAELQGCLERLFFDAPALRGLSRKYLTF